MEKNHIKYQTIIIILLTIFLGGCFDLEEDPISIVAPELYFASEDDVETAIFGAYWYFTRETTYGRQFTTALAVLDDIHDIIDPGTNLERRDMNNLNVDPANPMIWAFWPELYRAIGAANTAVDGLKKFTVTNQVRANQLEAEGRMIRALCYYDLVRLFGDIPYIDYAVTDPKSVETMTRTPVSEIYPKLIEDCLFGIQYLPEKRPNDIRCRPTMGAAKTMLASIYLTLGDYINAAKYAVEVINECAAYGFELMADYTDLWDGRARTADVAEYIWTVDNLSGTSDDLWGPMTGVRGLVDGRTDYGGWSVVGPSRGYLGMFDPGDHRIEATFILEGRMNINGVPTWVPYTDFNWTYDVKRPHFGKYRKYPGPNANSEGRLSGRNYLIYRLAEVYLMAAEALAEVNNGPTTEALGYLNKIRERARNGSTAADAPADYPAGMSKQDFINAVLKERMLEFGGEYKRWWDIVRRDLGSEAFGTNSIEPNPNREFNTVKKYLLPIPQNDRNRNPNLSQNDGYDQ